MNEIKENPNLIFDNINKLLNIGASDRKHPFHTPIFSNINELNLINSRVVVLRNYDSYYKTLNFHTDYRSPKIFELTKNNNSYFVFYDNKIKIQLRINTESIIHNRNAITKKAWENTQLQSRKCYLTKKTPSSKTKIPEDGLPKHLQGVDPSRDESETGYENFTVIENIIKNIDWLRLDSSGHKRLNINLINNEPKFDWLIP
tara:strand:- start:12396 stop:13001 length:606 start_codon:yes stop_codon:yes gene_type:complete